MNWVSLQQLLAVRWRRLDLPIKKTFGYKERSEEKRVAFQKEVEAIPDEHLVYLDESGIRKNEAIEFGWAKKGTRLHDLRNGARNKVLNLIGALSNKKLIAPFAFEGSCDTDVFNTYLFKVLKPCLNKHSVIILDNASFHRASSIEVLCQQIGCKFLFLPPYSPDLNKIEGYWVLVKTKLRKLLRDRNEPINTLIGDVYMAMNKIEWSYNDEAF